MSEAFNSVNTQGSYQLSNLKLKLAIKMVDGFRRWPIAGSPIIAQSVQSAQSKSHY